MKNVFILVFIVLGILLSGKDRVLVTDTVRADVQARTETNCTIGMAKDEARAHCQVPIPSGCTVAQFPGYDDPWADISKGGRTTCSFDPKQTDWKTRIVGTCDTCKTEHCTGRFTVMFNCTGNIPPANPASP